MNTEHLQQSRSVRPPSFGRDVFNFAFWRAFGWSLVPIAIIVLIGIATALNLAAIALVAGLGVFGATFGYSLGERQKTYDLWHTVPVTGRPPVVPAESQTTNEYWVALDNAQLKLPAEPKPGAIQKFFKALSTGAAGFNERDAGRFDYSRRQWVKLRDCFIREGWGEWVSEQDPQQGVELTPAGVAIIRAIAATRPPTPFDSEPAAAPALPHARTVAPTNKPLTLGERVV